MIVRLPSRFCSICQGKGYSRTEEMGRNNFVLVCPNITKNGKSEVMTFDQFDRRIRRIKRNEK